ncbi:hypothetical protein CKY04_05650 [Photorhabdus sp. S8-52]|nr:hypothetical protein CKY03_07580 [Photorhabdus sp. S9-53]RAX01013.1 hypothetical protein CKY05_07440 [Photorhabdus sp. S10-54]RAX05352.1 hypothetical protein CKY04_05650 [Photorhabdus sp. S8-52]
MCPYLNHDFNRAAAFTKTSKKTHNYLLVIKFIDIWLFLLNYCLLSISNAIIYYNSATLSRLLDRFEAEGNALSYILTFAQIFS